VIFWWVIFVFKAVKGKKSLQGEVMSESQPIVKEKEIIREIVKMRCPYCGNVYDETLDKCPHCGAKKP